MTAYRECNEQGFMFIHDAGLLPVDEQVDGHHWFVECPGQYRILFEDLNEADDWVWRQRDTGRPPDRMDHDVLADEHEVYGYYMDLRE